MVVDAQEEARGLGHEAIGSEHLLLGVLRGPGDGVAAGALDALGVTLADARDQVVRLTGRGTGAATRQMPFSGSAQRALEQALHEAQEFGHRGIRSEHLLLALVDDREGRSARVLLDFDANPEKVRQEVLRKLAVDAAAAQEASHPWHGGLARAAADPPPAAAPVAAGTTAGLVAGVAVGAFAFGTAIGIGLLLGRLIWG